MRATRPEAAGTLRLLRIAARWDRLRLPIWVTAGAALVVSQSLASQTFFDTPEALAAYRASAGSNPAIIALSGPPVGLDTAAGQVAFELSFRLILVAALMAMFTVVRHTRADEEVGRTELLRAAQIGRHAPLLAAVGLASGACVVLALAIGAAASATGLPVGGSYLLGASVGAAGLVFAGITAVAVQVSGSARACYGLVLSVLGVAFGVRAVGDIEGNGLSWASPIGWAQAVHPYSDDRRAPLLLCLVAVLALVGGAFTLLDHRDLGAGMLPTRPGPATAGGALSSPLGLAWRLQRGALTGWLVGVVLIGALYGGLGDAVQTLLADNPDALAFFPEATTAGLVDAYLATTLVVTVLLVSAAGVACVLRAHAEEAAGRVEPVLASATSRSVWLASHGLIAFAGSAVLVAAGGLATGTARALSSSDSSDVGRMLGAALAYVPAVWVLAGLALALTGLAPRAATAGSWGAVAVVGVVTLFGRSLDWPAVVRDVSPFSWVPSVPIEAWAPTSAAGLLAVAVVLIALGFGSFRRRDLATG